MTKEEARARTMNNREEIEKWARLAMRFNHDGLNHDLDKAANSDGSDRERHLIQAIAELVYMRAPETGGVALVDVDNWLTLEANAKQADAIRILTDGGDESDIIKLMAAGRAIAVLRYKWAQGSWRGIVDGYRPEPTGLVPAEAIQNKKSV